MEMFDELVLTINYPTEKPSNFTGCHKRKEKMSKRQGLPDKSLLAGLGNELLFILLNRID